MPAAALCWLSLPQMGEMGWTQFPGPALTIFRGKLGLRAMSCWSLGSQLRLGLGPGLAGGPSVRAKEPAVPARAEEAGAAGGRGARGPPWRSQAASRPLIRNSFSMNSGVPASLPRPTHRFLPGPPPSRVGGTARPARTPGPFSNLQGWVTALLSPTHPPRPVQEGGSQGGPGWLWHCPSATPAWPGLVWPACQQLQLPSQGWAGDRARGQGQAGLDRPVPHPKLQQERSQGDLLLLGCGCPSRLGHLGNWLPLPCSQFPPLYNGRIIRSTCWGDE